MHGIIVSSPAERRQTTQKGQWFGGLHNWDAEVKTRQFGNNWKASATRMINGLLGPLDGSFQGAKVRQREKAEPTSISRRHQARPRRGQRTADSRPEPQRLPRFGKSLGVPKLLLFFHPIVSRRLSCGNTVWESLHFSFSFLPAPPRGYTHFSSGTPSFLAFSTDVKRQAAAKLTVLKAFIRSGSKGACQRSPTRTQ